MILDFFAYIWMCFCFHTACVKTATYNTISEPFSRKTTHVPKVLLNTCMLDPDEGPCRGGFKMYYFDRSTKTCCTFEWGGCQGNGNRFDTEEKCMSECLSTSNTVKARPKWCSLTFDYGYCFGNIERWYYDPLYQTCKPRIYSGCGGNKNNFYNKEQCSSICIYGNGILRIKDKKKKKDEKKVLIIDPVNVTSKYSKNQ